ncbi:MAG: T9SS type A sorting domain-containing protein [Ginsengibacter sp.]
MKKFLLSLFTLFFALSFQKAESQLLYSNTMGTGFSYAAGKGSKGTPVILFDDVLIPNGSIPETDSMSVTKLKITIVRYGATPASVMKIYATPFDPATKSYDSFPAVPPTYLGTYNMPANPGGAVRTTVNVGDSVNSIFNFKVNNDQVYTGFNTIFVGVSFSDTTAGWELSNGPDDNDNVMWFYDVDNVKKPRTASYFGAGPTDPLATYRMQVFGKAKATATPVVLTNFDVQTVNSSNVLAWSTSQESNSNYYSVEHSTDGNNFEAIGQVAAAGNTSNVSNYSFTDDNPAAGINYYRLRMVDLDNSVKYSAIKSVKNAATTMSFSAYPNPAVETLNLVIPSLKSDRATLSVTNVSGQVVLKDEISVTTGNNKVPVKVSNLATGTYIIKVQLGTQSFIKKFNKL